MNEIVMSSPDIQEADISAVAEVVRTGRLSLGPRLEEFEAAFAAYVGAKEAIGVASGTAGLHVALLACGIAPGDLVITSPFSFVASVNSILYTGATPVFVDVDPFDGNLDLDEVVRAVDTIREGNLNAHPVAVAIGPTAAGGARLRAVLPVHVFGRLVDMRRLGEICQREGLLIIEDACEAIGARDGEVVAGTVGGAGVFAFYPNKQMTTGEGGMIVTSDKAIGDVCRSLRNQGRDHFDMWLEHSRLGFNYRMDEMSAALGLRQIDRIDELLAKRANVASKYMELLGDIGWLTVFGEKGVPDSRTSWFVFVIRLDAGVSRDGLIKHLEAEGIPSRPYFSPLHLQPYMTSRFGFKPGSFPVTEELGRQCLALPFSGVMSGYEVERVVSSIKAFRP